MPPNKEFMAVLGDNTQEHEVVSPLSTIKQALIEAMGETNGEVSVNITTLLDGEVIYNKIEKVKTRRGTRLINGGVN